jgi:hypothetical protein
MALSQNPRGGKGLSGFHVAVLTVYMVGLLSVGIGSSISRQTPAESQEPTLQPVSMPSFIDSSRSPQPQLSLHSFPVPAVPLNLKVPAEPQLDMATLQQELRENTAPSAQENTTPSSQENNRDDYVMQIQPYFLPSPSFKIAEPLEIPVPLKIAESPAERVDVPRKLFPLQFTQRFQPSMRTDAPPAK